MSYAFWLLWRYYYDENPTDWPLGSRLGAFRGQYASRFKAPFGATSLPPLDATCILPGGPAPTQAARSRQPIRHNRLSLCRDLPVRL